jgi:hypothetical protein
VKQISDAFKCVENEVSRLIKAVIELKEENNELKEGVLAAYDDLETIQGRVCDTEKNVEQVQAHLGRIEVELSDKIEVSKNEMVSSVESNFLKVIKHFESESVIKKNDGSGSSNKGEKSIKELNKEKKGTSISKKDWLKSLSKEEISGLATGRLELRVKKYKLLYLGGISSKVNASKNLWTEWLGTKSSDIVYIRDIGEGKKEMLINEEIAEKSIRYITENIENSFWYDDYKAIYSLMSEDKLNGTKLKLQFVKNDWALQSVKRATAVILRKLDEINEGTAHDILIMKKKDMERREEVNITRNKEKNQSSLLN